MKNPLDADARSYIDANVDAEFQGFACMIAKHESKQGNRIYNQFNSGEGNNALPNFGTPSGWGMCQIDKGANNCHTAILYDWHVNVAEMNDKLRFAVGRTTAFIGYYRDSYGQQANWTEPPPITLADGTASAFLWSVLTIYNGTGGIPGQTTPTHLRVFYSPLQFNPQSGTWTFYHNNTNPNYVNDVIRDSAIQEVE